MAQLPNDQQRNLLQMLSEWGQIGTDDHRLDPYLPDILSDCEKAGWIRVYHSHKDEWAVCSLTDDGKDALLGIA